MRGHNNIRDLFCKFGFTLAEVLIVLGIIGIVAQMTIPTLMRDVQEQTNKVAWKKAFSSFSQTFMQMQSNYTYDPTSHLTVKNSFLPAFKVIKDCDVAGSDCWQTSGGIKTLPLTDKTQYDFMDFSGLPGFITADGMKTVFYTNGSSSWVMVDVNGDKKPNVAGKDVFAMYFDPATGKTIPFADGTIYGNCKPPGVATPSSLTGLGCSTYYLYN